MRSRVFVERETCETAGDMEANLPSGRAFPPSNWGPLTAVGGVLMALLAGIVLSVPALIAAHESNGDLTTVGNVLVQAATAAGFFLVPWAVAVGSGAAPAEALHRLGLRPFRPSALKWMAAAIGAYLLFSLLYVAIVGEPHQKEIAEGFGSTPVQILLIAIAAPISEEVCFRGMLFGGLRERLPRIPAALITGLVFGGLHATTGVSAVPPLIAFGFILALLYEGTGSIVPGILLHMLNNSVALLAK
jgi:membrane protease YdiL (CAAX protease family)